ncbi:hypothetical protein MNB_SV-8-799 [hydrothermal vent metagenome]|uniref:Cytochrome c n=1 Tax=hydrothermal vent metagenome TaxID=652676 RepID=A0A1W1BE98_9ZZZZ
MKKIMMGLLTFGIFTFNAQAYDQTDRIKDMQSMESAMSQIQKGILYNNKDMVLQAVVKLKKAASTIEVAPNSELDYSTFFAKRQSSNIKKYADGIKKNMESGHKHGAASNYTRVLDECISCHNKIRKWN